MLYSMIDLAVIITAGLAAGVDLKTRKIPNWLTLTVSAAAIFGGFLFYALSGGWQEGWQWFLFSGKGWLVGMAVFLLPFIFGGMGGGDVKLMGAIGALKGVGFVIETALLGAFWGALLAVLAILAKRRPQILQRFGIGLKLFVMTSGKAGKDLMLPDQNADKKDKIYVPYGLAIFLGVLTAYLVDLNLPW